MRRELLTLILNEVAKSKNEVIFNAYSLLKRNEYFTAVFFFFIFCCSICCALCCQLWNEDDFAKVGSENSPFKEMIVAIKNKS